jgi:HSP20 family protein
MSRDSEKSGSLFLAAARAFQKTRWQPAVDVYRMHDGWLLKYELAGILPQDIRLTVHGHRVSLGGMRRDVRVEEQREFYSMEISYNEFERTLELPCELDAMHVSTDYRDGMLIVRLQCDEATA